MSEHIVARGLWQGLRIVCGVSRLCVGGVFQVGRIRNRVGILRRKVYRT